MCMRVDFESWKAWLASISFLSYTGTGSSQIYMVIGP